MQVPGVSGIIPKYEVLNALANDTTSLSFLQLLRGEGVQTEGVRRELFGGRVGGTVTGKSKGRKRCYKVMEVIFYGTKTHE